MVDFRKSFLLLVVLVAMTLVASGQAFNCAVNAGAPTIARQEGLAEEVGQVTLQCLGGTPTGATLPVPTVNITAFLNTDVTSRLLDTAGNSEALLIIDEPNPGNLRPCTPDSTGTCPVAGTGAYQNFGGPGTLPNVFQGRVIGNSVTWTGIPLDPPGTAAGSIRTLRIVNVRANATRIQGSSFIPGQIYMFLAITGTGAPGITNNQNNVVAFVQQGLSVSVTGTTALNQCEGSNSSVVGSSPTAGCPNFRVRFNEVFPTAFRPIGTGTPQNQVGTIYNTESMFSLGDGYTAVTSLDSAGEATNPTQLVLRLANVPAGARVFVTDTNLPNSTSTGTTVQRQTAASGTASVLPSNVVCTASTGSFPANTTGLTEVAVTGGAGSVTYDVMAANPSLASIVDIGVYIVFTPASTAPTTTPATISGNLGPISTVSVASNSAPVPRFIDSQASGLPTFSIAPCRTNLLFPFVTNQAGFDTGIAIANTSTTPTGSGWGGSAQSGTCRLNMYGASAPAAGFIETTSVASGTVAVLTLSAGGAGTTGAPGFQGYVIATCNFQYAHGYSFVSDLGARNLAMGYLALVLDTNQLSSRTGGNAAESLGQ